MASQRCRPSYVRRRPLRSHTRRTRPTALLLPSEGRSTRRPRKRGSRDKDAREYSKEGKKQNSKTDQLIKRVNIRAQAWTVTLGTGCCLTAAPEIASTAVGRPPPPPRWDREALNRAPRAQLTSRGWVLTAKWVGLLSSGNPTVHHISSGVVLPLPSKKQVWLGRWRFEMV